MWPHQFKNRQWMNSYNGNGRMNFEGKVHVPDEKPICIKSSPMNLYISGSSLGTSLDVTMVKVIFSHCFHLFGQVELVDCLAKTSPPQFQITAHTISEPHLAP